MIYVASSWRNPYYEDVVKRLRKEGLPVYDFRNPPHGGAGFHWTDVDENAPNWSFKEYADGLRHPLADGHASGSIIHLCRQCGAQIVGMGFLVEKGFAQGGQFLRDHSIPYHALATITRINEDGSMEVQ